LSMNSRGVNDSGISINTYVYIIQSNYGYNKKPLLTTGSFLFLPEYQIIIGKPRIQRALSDRWGRSLACPNRRL
jgi:hypothetical protein